MRSINQSGLSDGGTMNICEATQGRQACQDVERWVKVGEREREGEHAGDGLGSIR